MSSETLITLPDAETIMSRLTAVSDERLCVERLYPALARYAGKVRVPMGIVMMLQLAIADFTEGMPPMMIAVLNMNMNGYIDALVIDETAATEAKAHWAEAQKRAKAS